MSEISYTYQIQSDENLGGEDKILNEIQNYIQKEFTKVSFNGTNFSSSVKSKVLNPVIKFTGNIDIKVKENKSKVFLNVSTKQTGWFWFEIIVGFFFPVLWVILGIQWYIQKNKSSELFNNIGHHLDSRFSSF
jgi:hypothetical protein